MGLIDDKIKSLTGYFYKLERNPTAGWYEMEVAIPPKWVFKGNKIIECEVLNESTAGKFVLIKPKKEGIGIDDLIDFVELIVYTNKEISDREAEFNAIMEEEKKKLESKVSKFYTDMDSLRKESFNKFGTDGEPAKTNEEGDVSAPKTKRGRPPGSKNKPKIKSVSGTTK